AKHPKVLSSVAKLVAVIRTQKIRRPHCLCAVSAFMKKLRLRREVDLPAFFLEALAKIDVLIPGRIKLLIESADVIIVVASHHQRCGSRLFSRPRLRAPGSSAVFSRCFALPRSRFASWCFALPRSRFASWCFALPRSRFADRPYSSKT